VVRGFAIRRCERIHRAFSRLVLTGNREFESISLQRRVHREPDFRERSPSMPVGIPLLYARRLIFRLGFRILSRPVPEHRHRPAAPRVSLFWNSGVANGALVVREVLPPTTRERVCRCSDPTPLISRSTAEISSMRRTASVASGTCLRSASTKNLRRPWAQHAASVIRPGRRLAS
jgi:hypothetical protein